MNRTLELQQPKVVSLAEFRRHLASDDEHPPPPRPAAAARQCPPPTNTERSAGPISLEAGSSSQPEERLSPTHVRGRVPAPGGEGVDREHRPFRRSGQGSRKQKADHGYLSRNVPVCLGLFALVGRD